MKLSVIISCYAAEFMIEDCLESLREQTYEDIEVIVVDANSPDNTVKIIKDKFPNVILIETERIGVGAALNLGLRSCTGDIIVIDFNTDEVANTRWAEYIIDAFENQPSNTVLSPARLGKTKLVGAYGLNFNPNGSVSQIGYGTKYRPHLKSQKCDATGINVFPRELLKTIGYVDEDYLFYGADVDFSLRARLAGYSINTLPAAFTVHQRSASKAANSRKYYERMNYGIMMSSLVHGSVKTSVLSFGFYTIYMPLLAFVKWIRKLLRRQAADHFFIELIGRLDGSKLYIRNFYKNLQKRRLYPTKLI